jgi:hypothetical protein
MREFFNAQVQGTAIRNLSLVHFKYPAGECVVCKNKHSNYCRLECDTVVRQYAHFKTETARPSVTYLDTRRHIQEHNNIDVRGFLHHSTIHKEKSNKMQQCIKILLFHIYMKLNMFRETHRPSSGA